jgi:glycosyltransferase involved in cell wall biosynthesis
VLQVSSAHVYLAYPFVLSWSMLEAMAAGCAVIGSATAPVEEVIRDGENGMLVDFFDVEAIAGKVEAALGERGRFQAMHARARETVAERYDLNVVCLPRQIALVESLLGVWNSASRVEPPPERYSAREYVVASMTAKEKTIRGGADARRQ